MSSRKLQIVVFVAPRAGDEQAALPARLSELTGKSRSQVAIELQRGEVELLRSSDTEAVSQMVASAAAAGLLAIVREATSEADPAAATVEGWGRVLGAFDAKVAVAPVGSPERRVPGRSGAGAWGQQAPLRLSENRADSTGEDQPDSDTPNPTPVDLQEAAEERAAAPRVRGVRRQPSKPAPAKRFPLRAAVVLLTMALLAGLAAATYRKLNQSLAGSRSAAAAGTVASTRDLAEPPAPQTPAPEANEAEAQVKLLTDRARDACRNAEFERCKELADRALDLDETNRAAQAVHILAVTKISAAAGKPQSPPVSP